MYKTRVILKDGDQTYDFIAEYCVLGRFYNELYNAKNIYIYPGKDFPEYLRSRLNDYGALRIFANSSTDIFKNDESKTRMTFEDLMNLPHDYNFISRIDCHVIKSKIDIIPRRRSLFKPIKIDRIIVEKG